MSHDECISALISWIVVLTHDGQCPAAVQRKVAWDQAEVARFDNLRRVCGPDLDALNEAEREHTGEVARILREVEMVYFNAPATAATPLFDNPTPPPLAAVEAEGGAGAA